MLFLLTLEKEQTPEFSLDYLEPKNSYQQTVEDIKQAKLKMLSPVCLPTLFLISKGLKLSRSC